MLRLALLTTTLLVVGCASARTSALVASDSSSSFVVPAPRAEVVPPPASATGSESIAALETTPASVEYALDPAVFATASAPAEGEGLHSNRFTLKAGYYGSQEDGLDDGYIIGASWMRFLSKLFALELEVGYLDADGTDSGVDTDVWSIPIMLNGRFNVPIWALEGYAGLGVGGFYYDAEAEGPGVDVSDDGFLVGGNAFVGASINLADRLSLGLEAKYYVTDTISDLDSGLDAFTVMLTLGFGR